MLKQQLLTGDAWKAFVSHVRCGAYPDPAKFEADRADIEKAWPAYANDQTLSRLDRDLWAEPSEQVPHPWDEFSAPHDGWIADGLAWLARYNRRHQHAMSRMNHHIHPLSEETKERRVLSACKAKGNVSDHFKSFGKRFHVHRLLLCGSSRILL